MYNIKSKLERFYMSKKIILFTLLFISILNAANLNLNKKNYAKNENIVVNFTNMVAKNRDWIGIYPRNSSNAWGNVIAWEWTNDTTNGQLTFKNLPLGDYEVRAFYNNSFQEEAIAQFKIQNIVAKQPTVTTNNTNYTNNEKIIVTFSNMQAKNRDWIGIYPKNSSNAWGNVIAWEWTNDTTNGQITFNALPVGEYEARAFYNNSGHLETKSAFKVANDNAGPNKIVYEDAEDGIDPRWTRYSGRAMRLLNDGAGGSRHSIRTYAYSAQYITFEHPAKKLKYLEIDVRVGASSHNGNFGVYVNTTKGIRRILWSVYLNHLHGRGNPAAPFISGTEDTRITLNNPAPTDYFFETVGKRKFVHYKINVDKTLKLLEPNNEIISILLFTTAGGDFDNITLSAN